MLYVSKHNKKNDTYGVTDTDDGTTQFVSKQSLLKYTKTYGLDIKGVVGDEVTIVVDGVEQKGVLGVPKNVRLQNQSKRTRPVKARATGEKTTVVIDGKVEEAVVGPISFN